MPLIGTAGHVDHGKSTLIIALTGRDPDRWAEEKRRGLTIDLGFAWARLGDGDEISFVDVPGHERYLKNMLAGIEVIDVALFVVAADEGWMPQSEEHLAVLDLLGIHRGVVALTKTDLVDQETVELAALEIVDRLAGTSLEGAEVVAVSGRTGSGVDTLRSRLSDLAEEVVHQGSRPRLWVDRAFSVAGAGTVVTGTLVEGTLAVGDTVMLYPQAVSARIRTLQSHETSLERAMPGRRLAINLGGVEPNQVRRGSMVGLPGQWETTRRFTARIRVARYLERLPERASLQLHFGSGAHPARLRRVEDGLALVETKTPLPIRSGDRFILRDTGRRLVVAGGSVVDPAPGPAGRALVVSRAIDIQAGPDEIASALLRVRGAERLDVLLAHSGGGAPNDAVVVGATAFTQDRLVRLTQAAERLVTEHHDTHPLRPGMPLATLATMLDVDQEVAERIIRESPVLARTGPDVARVDHRVDLGPAHSEAWSRVEELLSQTLAVPTVDQLGLDPELLHLLVRTGRLVRVSENLVFLPAQIEELERILAGIEGDFTVADFRDRSGLSRKYAVPVLEWSDRKGLTVRRGDLRRVR